MRWVLAVAALLLPACSQDPARPPANDSTPPAPSPTVIDQQVIWPSERIDDGAVAALPEASRRALASSRVPVLLVSRPSLLATSVVMTKPRWTAISAEADGLHLSLSATRSAHRHPHLGPVEGESRVRGEPAFITQNEGIWSASWTESGVAYVIEIECASRPDPRCESDTHLKTLIDDLTYVGGEGAR